MSEGLSAERIAEIKAQADAAKRERLAATNGDRLGVGRADDPAGNNRTVK